MVAASLERSNVETAGFAVSAHGRRVMCVAPLDRFPLLLPTTRWPPVQSLALCGRPLFWLRVAVLETALLLFSFSYLIPTNHLETNTMPGLLARSKSLRLLRGGRKDVRQEETQPPVPIPQSIKADLDTCKSAAPLPTTAKQPETPIPATRPRTSNGPGDRTPLFHKKTTPVPSIYSQDHIQSLPSLASSTTVLPSAQGREGQGADTGVIGIALGSPTRGSHWNIATPQNSNHNVQSSVKNTDMGVCRAATTPSANGRPEPPKSKLSRWKSLFRRTPRLPTQQEKKSFYQVAPALPTDRADSHHGNESLDHQAPENQKEEIDTLSPPTYKPDIRKSRQAREDPVAHPLPAQPRQRAWTVGANSTDPRRTRVKRASTVPSLSTQSLAQKSTAVSQVAQTAFVKSPLQNVLQDSSTVPHVEIMSSPQILTAGASQEIPQLDINIPEVKLDRYSVMFNNVIEQPQSQTASLLERRQGNVEKLRPLIGLSNKVCSKTNFGFWELADFQTGCGCREPRGLSTQAQSNLTCTSVSFNKTFISSPCKHWTITITITITTSNIQKSIQITNSARQPATHRNTITLFM